ncbi:unnamed protein product [Chrysoparadoxa australica]
MVFDKVFLSTNGFLWFDIVGEDGSLESNPGMGGINANMEALEWVDPALATRIAERGPGAERMAMGRSYLYNEVLFAPATQPLIAPYMTDWDLEVNPGSKVLVVSGEAADGSLYSVIRWENIAHIEQIEASEEANIFEVAISESGDITFFYPQLTDYTGTGALGGDGAVVEEESLLSDAGRSNPASRLTAFIGLVPWLYDSDFGVEGLELFGLETEDSPAYDVDGIISEIPEIFCFPKSTRFQSWPIFRDEGLKDCGDYIGAFAVVDEAVAPELQAPGLFVAAPGYMIKYTASGGPDIEKLEREQQAAEESADAGENNENEGEEDEPELQQEEGELRDGTSGAAPIARLAMLPSCLALLSILIL